MLHSRVRGNVKKRVYLKTLSKQVGHYASEKLNFEVIS